MKQVKRILFAMFAIACMLFLVACGGSPEAQTQKKFESINKKYGVKDPVKELATVLISNNDELDGEDAQYLKDNYNVKPNKNYRNTAPVVIMYRPDCPDCQLAADTIVDFANDLPDGPEKYDGEPLVVAVNISRGLPDGFRELFARYTGPYQLTKERDGRIYTPTVVRFHTNGERTLLALPNGSYGSTDPQEIKEAFQGYSLNDKR